MRPTIEAIYDEHVWRLYGFFAYRLGSREDAEDLTQQVFERAVKALDRYDDQRASVGTWLMSIANNLLTDHFRRGGARPSVATDPVVLNEMVGATEAFVDLGLDADLAGALARLNERERELLALRYGAEMTGPEIAELKDLSLANVQQILSRALRSLRAELADSELAPRSGRS